MPKKTFYSIDRHGSTNHDDKKVKLGILSEDMMSYYRNVSSSLEQGFDGDPDLKDKFLTNVYNTLRDEGVQVSQNQTVSRILEVLFSHSEPGHMQDLFCVFCGQLTVVVFDRFASHVFQALIQYLPAMYEDSGGKEEEFVWRKSFHDNVKILCDFMESHLRDIMTHTYGSHILRSFLEALGGVHVREEVVRSRISRGQRKDTSAANAPQSAKSIPQTLSTAFASSFKDVTSKLIRLCNFEDHLSDQNFCPVLQTVLLILHKADPEGYQSLADTIIEKTKLYHHNDEAGVDDVARRLPDIVQNDVGSYVVELLLSLASDTQLQEIYNNLFKKRIIYFAVHPIANYVLQKMLSSVQSADMMEELLQDISPYLEDILAVNHIGIVTKLSEACKRTGTQQETFLKALMGAFHCADPEENQKKIAPLLASLQTYETFHAQSPEEGNTEGDDSKSVPLLKTPNYHGCVLLQHLLNFNRTALVSSSLLALSAPELVGLCCSPCGSHVIDAFFSSPTVLEKFKVAFVKKLQGSFINVACNRNGSRCLENVWKCCSLKQRIHLAEDLAKSQERLEGDQWGRFLHRNFALYKFSQRRKEWLDIQNASNKKKQLIKDILEGTSGKTKKKAKKPADDSATQPDDSATQPNVQKSPTKNVDEQVEPKKKVKSKDKIIDRKVSEEETANTGDVNNIADVEDHTDPDLDDKKKRKRKKNKKRLVRGGELENVIEIEVAEETEKKAKKSKKRKQVDECAGSDNELNMADSVEHNIIGKKKKRERNLLCNKLS